MIMMASIPFSGEYGDPEFTNVNAAAAELRQAGFEVFRLPDKYHSLMAHPFDDFVEVRFEGSDDPDVHPDHYCDVINAIVSKYGGDCIEWGPIEPGDSLFAGLFAECGVRHDDER
jgi:hypothetical protein